MLIASKQSFLNDSRAGIIHLWDFRESVTDMITGEDAYIYNSPVFTDNGIRLNGSQQYINLGSQLLPQTNNGCTIEVVSAKHSNKRWSRVFDFGSDTTNYFMISWAIETSNSHRFSLKQQTEWNADKTCGYQMDTFWHFSTTFSLSDEGIWYANYYIHDLKGDIKAEWEVSNKDRNWSYLSFIFQYFWLGRSFFPSDAYSDATYMFVRFWDKPLLRENISELSSKIL